MGRIPFCPKPREALNKGSVTLSKNGSGQIRDLTNSPTRSNHEKEEKLLGEKTKGDIFNIFKFVGLKVRKDITEIPGRHRAFPGGSKIVTTLQESPRPVPRNIQVQSNF